MNKPRRDSNRIRNTLSVHRRLCGKSCEYCGAKFYPQRTLWQKYCSDVCRGRGPRDKKPEKYRAKQRAWRLRNRDWDIERKRRARELNGDRINAQQRASYRLRINRRSDALVDSRA